MSQFPRAFAFLLLVSISSRFVFGEVSNPTHQAILFCLTLFLFAMTIEKQVFTHARSRNPVIGAFTIWVIFFFLPPQVEVFRLLCLVLLSFLLGKSSQDRNPQVATLFWALGISTLFLAGLIWLYQIEPLLWSSGQAFSVSASTTIGNLTRNAATLGVTASAIPITILFLVFGVIATLLSVGQSKLNFTIYSCAVLLLNSVYVASLQHITRSAQWLVPDITFHPMNFPILLVFLYALPLGWYMRKVTLVPISFALHSFRRVPLLLGVFCIMFVAGLQYFPSLNVSHRLNSILIYNRGYLNWDKPTFGKYGFRASGMFGMLAENMMSMGYHVEFDSTLTEKKLGRTSVVVMINLNQQVPVDQKERLKRFVKKGGSLLVMGDHTGLAGTMAPLNGILDFTGIEFKFDCGHYLKKDWRDSFQFASHTIFKGVRDEIDVGISVGASLKISPITARPLILGKYAFSDNGDILNTGNGYLGDRLYNQGELLGDIVLVAEAMYGNGKVLVFGDTSSFQNGSVVWDFRFLQNIFGYLISSAGDWSNIHRRLLVILLCLCAVVVVLFPGGGLKDPSIVVWLTVTILLVVGILSLFGETQPAKPSPNHRIAYIDASHLNRFTQYGDDGIWALSYHLMRNNHIPIVVREFSPQLLRKCSVAFFINPAASIQTDVLATIDEYVKNGGVVVWSVGNEEKDAVANVMAAYGFDIDNIPLGPVPVNETSAGIQFSKAWPIQIRKGENIDTLCSGWGYPVIGSKNVAKGKVVLIADPLFLLSENLEANHKLQNSNHLFLRMITNESNAGPVVENTLTSVPLSQISKKDGMIR